MLQTDTQGHANSMTMLQVWILEAFVPVSHTLCYLYYCTVGLSVCLSASSVEPADRMSRNMTSYIWRLPKHRRLPFPTISDNMAERRIYELVTTQASLLQRNKLLFMGFGISFIVYSSAAQLTVCTVFVQ